MYQALQSDFRLDFEDFGSISAIFSLFLTNFPPCRPPNNLQLIKNYTGISVILADFGIMVEVGVPVFLGGAPDKINTFNLFVSNKYGINTTLFFTGRYELCTLTKKSIFPLPQIFGKIGQLLASTQHAIFIGSYIFSLSESIKFWAL